MKVKAKVFCFSSFDSLILNLCHPVDHLPESSPWLPQNWKEDVDSSPVSFSTWADSQWDSQKADPGFSLNSYSVSSQIFLAHSLLILTDLDSFPGPEVSLGEEIDQWRAPECWKSQSQNQWTNWKFDDNRRINSSRRKWQAVSQGERLGKNCQNAEILCLCGAEWWLLLQESPGSPFSPVGTEVFFFFPFLPSIPPLRISCQNQPKETLTSRWISLNELWLVLIVWQLERAWKWKDY